MLISPILPRPLDPSNQNESLTVLNAIISQVHLDRPLARRLGWRGVFPSSTHWPSWTVRIAGSAYIYGITYTEESLSSDQLVGRFMLYAFPENAEIAENAGFSLWAQRIVADENYQQSIRQLSQNVQPLMPFYVGDLELSLSPNGEGLALILSALSRQTIESRVEEGIVADLKPLRILMPLFSTLAASTREVLGKQGEIVANQVSQPALTLTEEGFEDDEARSERLISVTLAMGQYEKLIPGHRLSTLPLSHRPTRPEARDLPIVHVLTGFLGAGKTTFLKNWLEYLHSRERFTGVVQNEFGEVDLDSLVLKGETKVESLEDGCVCCSLADSLRPGLIRLIETTPAEQFILETTGVASPSSVASSLTALNDIVSTGLVITLVDAYDLVNHPEKLMEEGCRKDQIDCADILVCSKADLVEESELKALMQKLHKRNEQALVLPAFEGNIPFAWIDAFFVRWLDEQNKPLPSQQVKSEPKGWSGMRRAWGIMRDENNNPYESFTVEFDRAVTLEEVQALIDDAGSGVCRAKGLVDIVDKGCHLVQYAASRLECEEAEEALAKVEKRYLVVIGEGLQTQVQ